MDQSKDALNSGVGQTEVASLDLFEHADNNRKLKGEKKIEFEKWTCAVIYIPEQESKRGREGRQWHGQLLAQGN